MNKLTLLLSVVLMCTTATAQYQNVMISDVSAPEEPSITMNFRNPDLLMAGANLRSYYFSEDGGLTWTRGDLFSNQHGVYGDPCLITDTAGNFYYFHLSNPPSGQGNWLDRIVCQRYDADTHTWNDGSAIGLNPSKDQDKEWAVVDSSTNTIYVTWTQFDEYGSSDPNDHSNILFSKSDDLGETWSTPLQINEVPGDCLDSDNTVEGAVPAVGPNGEIYVAWAGPLGIVFDRSTDGGQTWLDNDIFVSDQPGGWDYEVPGIYRCNGLPVTCCDISDSPYRGTIYVNWTDQRNGSDDTDVWIAKSTDGGDTWSAPIRVNDDSPGRQQFFSWMTVDNATGAVYVVFYDRRNYIDNHTDVYLARSTDGGETFENIKISDSPFNPVSYVFFGDYTNITAYNNIIHPIWTRADITSLSVWTAIVDLSVGIPRQEKTTVFLEQNRPNPFAGTTEISFTLDKPGKVTLSVTDTYGRTVATLLNNQYMEQGAHKHIFNNTKYRLTPGIYYYRLKTGGKLLVKKMTVSG